MGTVCTVKQVAFAKRMYLDGWPYSEIGRILSGETGKPTPVSLLRRWSKDRGWDRERTAPQLKAAEKVAKEARLGGAEEPIRAAIEYREAYHKLWQRGLEALRVRDPKSSAEAARLIDLGIKGERGVSQPLVSLAFAYEVYNAIEPELDSDEARGRAAQRVMETMIRVAEIEALSKGPATRTSRTAYRDSMAGTSRKLRYPA